MPFATQPSQKRLHPVDRTLYLCNMGILHTLRTVVGLLGRKTALRLGRLLGQTVYSVAGRLRKKMLLNLGLAYGDALSLDQKKQIARDSLAHFFANWAEIFFAGGTRLDQSMQTISIEGTEHLEDALAHGHGVIAVSAHLGTFPFAGTRLTKEGYTFLMAVRDLESPAGSAMYARCRELIELPAIATVPEKNFYKTTLGLLRSGGILGIIADENKRHGGVFVDFFGRSASTAAGPAVLARRTGAVIVPIFIIRNPDDTQTIHIHKPVLCARTDDEQRDIREATEAFTLSIEQQIRRDPAQWSWSNWRWRTQPHGKDDAAKIRKKNYFKRLQKYFKRLRD